MLRKLFHASFVAEDTPFRPFRRRVDGKNGKLPAVTQHMKPEHVDRRRFPRPRHAGYTYPTALTRIRQALLNHLMGNRLMRRGNTFDKGHCTCQTCDIPFQNPLHQLRSRRQGGFPPRFKVGIDNGGLRHPGIHGKAAVFRVILRMVLHDIYDSCLIYVGHKIISCPKSHQCASSQLLPVPEATSSGTEPLKAPLISRVTSSCNCGSSSGTTLNTSSS